MARDRNPRWAVGRLLDEKLKERGMLPEELADATGIGRTTIYNGLSGSHVSARNLAVIRPVLRITWDELEAALLVDFTASGGAREDLADLRDQLQEMVDADQVDAGEAGSGG